MCLCYCLAFTQVLGGADLFLQGLIVPPGGLGEWSVGDVRAVAIPDNPYPFAVRPHEAASFHHFAPCDLCSCSTLSMRNRHPTKSEYGVNV